VLLAFAGFGLYWGTWGASVPAIEAHSRSGNGVFGVALAVIGVSALASMRASGLVVDWLGGHGLPVTVSAFAAAAVLPSLATSPATLMAALALVGATSGAFDVAANAEGTRYETAAKEPLLNLAHALFSIGVVGGSLVTGLARSVTHAPWPPFVLVALLLVLIALFALFLEAAPTERSGERERPSSWWRIPPALALFGFLAALAYFVENAWQSWSSAYLAGPLGRSPGAAALGPAAFAGAAASGRLIGQRLSRRLSEWSLLIVGAAIAAAGTIAAAIAHSAPYAYASIAVAGLGTSVCAPSVLSLAGQAAPIAERASAISIVTTLAYLGFIVGPLIVGLIAAAADLRIAFVAVAAVAIVLGAMASASLRLRQSARVPAD
jgi:predicted MFS family arabinose efflux permease